jgi:hypothetical protein
MKKLKRKKGGNRKIKKYQPGGMYSPNVIPGTSLPNSTTNIVQAQNDPNALANAEASQQDAVDKANISAETLASNLKNQESQNKVDVNNAAAKVGQKADSYASMAKTGFDVADKAGAFKKYKTKKALQQAMADPAKASERVKQAGVKNAATIAKVGKGAFTETLADTAKTQLVTKGVDTGGGTLINVAGSKAGSYGMDATSKFAAPVINDATSGIITNSTGTLAKDVATKAVTKGTGKLAGVGGAGAAGATGLAKFATSGAGLGTIANLAGTGIKMASDDGDATKSNAGEYGGAILAGAGTGASYGSMFGPVGTAVGAVGGAIYGGVKQ